MVRPADAAQRRLGQTDHVRECEYDEADDTHRCDDVLQDPNSRVDRKQKRTCEHFYEALPGFS